MKQRKHVVAFLELQNRYRMSEILPRFISEQKSSSKRPQGKKPKKDLEKKNDMELHSSF